MEEHEDLEAGGEDDTPWLREMVEDDLLGLFSDEREEVARTARLVRARVEDDPGLLERLIDALHTSLEHGNDDTEASVWIALLLGEIRDLSALPVLFLGLGAEDEALQEAASHAVLKIGPPAVMALLERLEEEEQGPEFREAAYRVLGSVGSLLDERLRERAMDFLAERVERETAQPADLSRIESLFQASALLGDRRMLPSMERVQREKFRGRNTAIRDSQEMLAENTAGTPLRHDPLPWVEEHRWLFEEDPESYRVKRPRAPVESGEDEGRSRVSGYYWGLSFLPEDASSGDDDSSEESEAAED